MYLAAGLNAATRRKSVFLILTAALAAACATLAPGSARAETPQSINMKILVISADGKEPILAGITSILQQINVPYDVVIASQTPSFASANLSDGSGRGYYQGVLLTTGNLAYEAAPGNWQSAFTANQWQALWTYEATYRVRQSTLYTYPVGAPDNYCLAMANQVGTDTTTTPVTATLTDDGKKVFNYLNAALPLKIQGAWTYLAQSAGAVPLAVTNDGTNSLIASICNYADGRQNLTITTDGNPELLHTLGFGYGVINWVSKGFFLGERKVYMNPQPDDVLIEDNIWDPARLTDTSGTTYRMTGGDYNALVSWQKAMNNAHPNNANLTIEMPFNGVGASGIYKRDTLTPAIQRNNTPFKWISHTYNHTNLNTIDIAGTTYELGKNNTTATQILKLQRNHLDSMVQPEISGLNNSTFLTTAYAAPLGIRYILSDTSHPEWRSSIPNEGFYSQYAPGMLIIPRYPTNLYYNVSTPTEWMSEYNYFYRSYWGTDLTYREILDKESKTMLGYLLKYHINPLMFHQPNLRAYNGTNSLMGDLLQATMDKYNALFTLPVMSPSQHETGVKMAERMAYNVAKVNGVLSLDPNGNKITLTAQGSANVPVTGLGSGNVVETYGGQQVSTFYIKGGTSIQVAAPTW